MVQCRVHAQASFMPPMFFAIALFNFLTFPLHSSPIQVFFLFLKTVCLLTETSLQPHEHEQEVTQLARAAKYLAVNFQVFMDETMMVRWSDILNNDSWKLYGDRLKLIHVKNWLYPRWKPRYFSFL